MKNNNRGCNNCAWGKLLGDSQVCLAKYRPDSYLGQLACDDGEVWCDQWNSFQLNLGYRQSALVAWRQAGDEKKEIETQQKELFGPIGDLHK